MRDAAFHRGSIGSGGEHGELSIRQPGSDTAALSAVKGDSLHCFTTAVSKSGVKYLDTSQRCCGTP